MNQDIMHGKWTEIKGEIRKMWGKVTSDELEKSKGDLTSIKGIIQQRYGARKEEVSDKIDTIVESFNDKSKEVKRSVDKMADVVKKDLKK